MTIGVTEEHAALTEAVSGWASRHGSVAAARAAMTAPAEKMPEFWDSLAGQGLLGMHLAEAHGGGGATAVELAVAMEAFGRALTPGPVLPTVVTSAVLSLAGAGDLAAGLADGSRVGAMSFGGPLVLGAPTAEILVVPSGGRWLAVAASSASIRAVEGMDATRGLGEVTVTGEPLRTLDVDDDTVREVAVTLAAAEAAGIAGWCVETAAQHAKVREQFGRPIGQFQAVKHTCADMLVLAEQARAAAWDAARALTDPAQRPLAAAVAGATALDAAVTCAKACIQVLGGIGFTWEHDAHLYLRRAVALRQLLGPTSRWRAQAARLALDGVRRTLDVQLDDQATAGTRAAVRAFAAELQPLDERGRRERMAAEGYVAAHWPRPWGRDASPAEQLVIDAELRAAGIKPVDLVIGAWILPTLIAHGTVAQQERFVGPTLRGEISWCQLFSEPGAGSDLAALQTRATRTEGGWLLDGQKVWTSLAHRTDFGLCLARTDPDAPKHKGITCFVVDMTSPGLDIRPLREITGREMFNEVFLDGVFVPDECVVGAVNDGWRAGRTTLANERVAMSAGSTMGAGVEGLLSALRHLGDEPDAVVLDRLGALVAEGQVLAVLGLRTTMRQLSGMQPGAASSVRKLVGTQHAQSCAELALELLGSAGAGVEGPAQAATHGFLQSRCLTIAGGTTEVQRNVIAERLLGLPRD